MKHKVITSFLTTLMLGISINAQADTPQPQASNESDGIIEGHEYVDLGLPSRTLWATYNVGASSPYEKGDYFAWGEVEPRDDFSWETYKFFEGYEYDPERGEWAVLEDIGTDICGTEYDAARHQWGGRWRMPNDEETYELRMMCWNKWTTENGIHGIRIHGPNEHSIFLPVCGYGCWEGEMDPFNYTEGSYWSGVDEPAYGFNGQPIEPSMRAKTLLVDSGGLQRASVRKAYGLNIRAVINLREAGIEEVASDSKDVMLIYRDGYIQIVGDTPDGIVRLYDLSGRMVFSGSAKNGVCPLPSISNGIYLVSYSINGNVGITQKLVI